MGPLRRTQLALRPNVMSTATVLYDGRVGQSQLRNCDILQFKVYLLYTWRTLIFTGYILSQIVLADLPFTFLKEDLEGFKKGRKCQVFFSLGARNPNTGRNTLPASGSSVGKVLEQNLG